MAHANRLEWVAVFRQPEMGTSFFPVRETLSMNSSRRAGWYYRWWGEWFGPETMKQLVKSTSHLPRTVVLAVDLDDRQISDINVFPKTAYLTIDSSKITSKVTESIQGLPDLIDLSLSGPQITDDSLRELASLKSLKNVRLGNTSCTEEGIRSLLESLPVCDNIETIKTESGSYVFRQYELTSEGKMVQVVRYEIPQE